MLWYLIQEKVPTVEEKSLLGALPYLGVISLQTRTKLQQTSKVVLNFWTTCSLSYLLDSYRTAKCLPFLGEATTEAKHHLRP